MTRRPAICTVPTYVNQLAMLACHSQYLHTVAWANGYILFACLYWNFFFNLQYLYNTLTTLTTQKELEPWVVSWFHSLKLHYYIPSMTWDISDICSCLFHSCIINFTALHSSSGRLFRLGKNSPLRNGPPKLGTNAANSKEVAAILQDQINHGTIHGGYSLDIVVVCGNVGWVSGFL